LARSFRYYEKKRGNRRTGSPALASAGEAIFFGVLLALGCGGLILLFVTLVVPQWRVNVEFVEQACKVRDTEIKETRDKDGTRYVPKIKIEYEVAGETNRTWTYDIQDTSFARREDAQAILDQFDLYDKATDNLYPCWYNPANPGEAVLVRGYRWWIWLAFTVPIAFVLIGAGGLLYALLHWGKSAERRAAMTQHAQQRDPFAAAGRGDRRYPFVPQGADVTNSPGTRLRFRLPVARPAGWMLFGAIAFCLTWNACVVVAMVWAARGFMDRNPDWVLTVLILPFLLIGAGAVFFLVRKLLIATGIGATLVEISGHPLHPGMQYRLFLSQAGTLKMNVLRASLVCRESAAYRQGTNTRTETQEVYRQELLQREAFQIQRGRPFETEFDLNVPGDAMHSFVAEHTQVGWTLVVEGDVAGWPNFQRAFTVIVQPGNGDAES
jgi:hypothetical protein